MPACVITVHAHYCQIQNAAVAERTRLLPWLGAYMHGHATVAYSMLVCRILELPLGNS